MPGPVHGGGAASAGWEARAGGKALAGAVGGGLLGAAGLWGAAGGAASCGAAAGAFAGLQEACRWVPRCRAAPPGRRRSAADPRFPGPGSAPAERRTGPGEENFTAGTRPPRPLPGEARLGQARRGLRAAAAAAARGKVESLPAQAEGRRVPGRGDERLTGGGDARFLRGEDSWPNSALAGGATGALLLRLRGRPAQAGPAALACGGAAAALHLADDRVGFERLLRRRLIAMDLLEGPAPAADEAGTSALEALAAAWPAWLPSPVRVLSEDEHRARLEARNLATHGERRLQLDPVGGARRGAAGAGAGQAAGQAAGEAAGQARRREERAAKPWYKRLL